MIEDPIVREIREAGEAMAAEANYDVHQFFKNLKELEERCEMRRAKLHPAQCLREKPLK